MALASGTRLGPYEILSPIGAGGMGEVYRAKDTRLDRVVAIKVVLGHVSANAEFRERFDREARAISSLDHPHICTLHDVGHEGDIDFLVMQFLEGETLADRLSRASRPTSDPTRAQAEPSAGASTDIATAISTISTMSRGPLPLDVTLRYAAEIASALDAAHRRSIVHRDLKPGNVMLTKSGTKLLDFGLAKLAEQSPVGGFGDMATRTAPLTGQGALLGTLHYMSPEQLEGREVDSRSDIFAFGALLFEMLSGRRAFESPSHAGVIAAIIGADPPPLGDLADVKTRLPLVAHHALERLLKKCLAKNPDDRWQSAADLSDELKWINEERLRAAVSADGPVAASAPALPAPRGRERVWMGVAAAATTIAIAVGVWLYPKPVPPPEPISFTVDAATEGETLASGAGLVSISPDGQSIAFLTGESTARKLWIRKLGSLTATPVASGSGAWHPVWSPDGRSIAFTTSRASASLKRIDVVGGPAITLAEQTSERSAWSPQGVILHTGADGRLFSVPERGGTSTPVTELDKGRAENQHAWPVFLPDGRRFVYCARSSDPAKSALYLASLDSPGRTHLVDVLSMAEYVPGYLLYQREGTLIAHPFDDTIGTLTGDPRPVLEDVQYNASNGRAAFAVSPTGVLVYRTGSAITSRSSVLAWFDATGKELSKVGDPADFFRGALSPEGHRFVVSQWDALHQQTDLFMIDLDRGVSTPFVSGPGSKREPVWSIDGQTVVFASNRKSAAVADLYVKAAGGAAADRVLFESAETKAPTGFSPDGKTLLYTAGAAGVRDTVRLWTLSMTGDPKPTPVFPGSSDSETAGQFSPDGRWIAYVVNQTGPSDGNVYVQSYPPNGVKTKISTTQGFRPKWTADGKRIIYLTAEETFMSVDVTIAGGQLRVGLPKPLFVRRQNYSNSSSQYAMDPQGNRFLLVVNPNQLSEQTVAPIPLTVVVNWAQGLLKKK